MRIPPARTSMLLPRLQWLVVYRRGELVPMVLRGGSEMQIGIC